MTMLKWEVQTKGRDGFNLSCWRSSYWCLLQTNQVWVGIALASIQLSHLKFIGKFILYYYFYLLWQLFFYSGDFSFSLFPTTLFLLLQRLLASPTNLPPIELVKLNLEQTVLDLSQIYADLYLNLSIHMNTFNIFLSLFLFSGWKK